MNPLMTQAPAAWRRWAFAAATVTAVHGAALATLVGWSATAPSPGQSETAAVVIDLAPISASPEPEAAEVAPADHHEDVASAAAAPPPPTPEPEPAHEPVPPPASPGTTADLVARPPVAPKPPPVTKQTEKKPPLPPREAAPAAAHRTAAPPKAQKLASLQGAAAGTSPAARMSYAALLSAHLQRFKQYPAAARANGDHGTAVLTITVGRSGQVLSARLGRSSGSAALDAETLALARRAQPLPAFPSDIHESSLSFSQPISYALH